MATDKDRCSICGGLHPTMIRTQWLTNAYANWAQGQLVNWDQAAMAHDLCNLGEVRHNNLDITHITDPKDPTKNHLTLKERKKDAN